MEKHKCTLGKPARYTFSHRMTLVVALAMIVGMMVE